MLDIEALFKVMLPLDSLNYLKRDTDDSVKAYQMLCLSREEDSAPRIRGDGLHLTSTGTRIST